MAARSTVHHREKLPEHDRELIGGEMWATPMDLTGWEPEDHSLTYEELRKRERQIQVDHVKEMIPFWRRAVEAAEKGEVLRMEDFLESLHDDRTGGWGNEDDWAMDRDNPWEGRMDDWAKPAIWVDGRSTASSVSGKRTDTTRHQTAFHNHVAAEGRKSDEYSRGRHKNQAIIADGPNSYAFVEDVALREAVDTERRKRMHLFFEMPTEEKVRKIQEIIRFLHERG